MSGVDSYMSRSVPISMRGVNLCTCVDLSWATVVRMLSVASGLNPNLVKSVWSSESIVVLEWRLIVGSKLGLREWSMKGERC